LGVWVTPSCRLFLRIKIEFPVFFELIAYKVRPPFPARVPGISVVLKCAIYTFVFVFFFFALMGALACPLDGGPLEILPLQCKPNADTLQPTQNMHHTARLEATK